MTGDKSHLIVKAKKLFGRIDYVPVNDTAMHHLRRGENVIPAYKIAELEAAGYRVEVV